MSRGLKRSTTIHRVWRFRALFFALLLSCDRPILAPVAPTTYEAPAHTTLDYTTDLTPPTQTTDPILRLVEDAVTDAASANALTVFRDARLDEVAAWHAMQRLKNRVVLATANDFAATHLGLTMTPRVLHVVFDDTSTLRSRLLNEFLTIPKNFPYARFGRAIASYGSLHIAVIALARDDVTLSTPIARHVHVGETEHLAGTLNDSFGSVELWITDPNGVAINSSQGLRVFDLPFTPSVPGVYRVELLGDANDGPAVIVNIPIYVDTSEPLTFTESFPGDNSSTTTEIADKLFAMLNTSRVAARLPPLKRFEPLTLVAKANSEDMAQHHYFAHVSPTTGSVGRRIRHAGLSLNVTEAISRGGSAIVMHEGLMESPAHRAALLDKDFTHVGIGVAWDLRAERYVATELFARVE